MFSGICQPLSSTKMCLHCLALEKQRDSLSDVITGSECLQHTDEEGREESEEAKYKQINVQFQINNEYKVWVLNNGYKVWVLNDGYKIYFCPLCNEKKKFVQKK